LHHKRKREKRVGTPFPRVPDPLHPWLYLFGTFKMIWPVVLNLGFAPRSTVFNVFLGFSSEDLGIFNLTA